MKIKDFSVKDIIVIKYLACKFVIDGFKDDPFFDTVINEMAKDRLAEKHNILDANKKSLDEVVHEITDGHTKEEKEGLISSVYDYVVNKMFTIENLTGDEEDIFKDSLIIKPTHKLVMGKLKWHFDTIEMRIMTRHDFEYAPGINDITVKRTMFASANHTGQEFAIIII